MRSQYNPLQTPGFVTAFVMRRLWRLFPTNLLRCLCLFFVLFCGLPTHAFALKMKNKIGYVAAFPFNRGHHIPPKIGQYRIGRNSWELGVYDDGGFGLSHLFRTTDATYVAVGPVFGSFDTVGVYLGVGVAYKLLSFVNLRGELFGIGNVNAIVSGTGVVGVEVHL